MKTVIMSVATAAALMFGAAGANAVPATVAAPGSDTAARIIPVAEGCGPGFHRNFRGFCVPGGFYGRGFGYGYGYGPRCFIRDTFYGPRRICRY